MTYSSIEDHLKRITKGGLTISEYFKNVRRIVDELILLGKPMDDEDVIEQIFKSMYTAYEPVIAEYELETLLLL